MSLKDLRPAGDFAMAYGAKTLVYGPQGAGKTPTLNTAPRPILLCTEPGLLSMRGSTVPTALGFDTKSIDDFFKWIMSSNEAANFDTIGVDSVSQMAEIVLNEELARNKDGRKAYGEMSRRMMAHLNALFFVKNKHTYLICRQQYTNEIAGRVARPDFPGQDLNVRVPHLYDVIMQMDTHSIPGVGPRKALRTAASIDAIARDRSGKLAEFEPCDLTALFGKIMS